MPPTYLIMPSEGIDTSDPSQWPLSQAIVSQSSTVGGLTNGVSYFAVAASAASDLFVPNPQTALSIFGFNFPPQPPANFPGTMTTEAEAEAVDVANWNFDDPAFTIVNEKLVGDGSNAGTSGAGPVTAGSATAGDRIATVALVNSASGDGGRPLAQGGSSATSAYNATTGWRQGTTTISDTGPVSAEYTARAGAAFEVERIEVHNLTEMLAQKWFIVPVISQSNWIGDNLSLDPAIDTPAYGCVSFEPRFNGSTGASTDENGHARPRLAIDPMQHQTFNGGGGPGTAFLREVRKFVPEEYTVVYLCTGYAGGGFSGDAAVWNKDGSTGTGADAYSQFWTQVRYLWSQAPAGSVMGGIVFCQGETDSALSKHPDWRAKAPALLQECRDEPGWGEVPIVVAEIGYESPDAGATAMIAMQQELATGSGADIEFSRCAYVPRPAGATFEADGTHFDQPTQRQRGYDVARALHDLIYSASSGVQPILATNRLNVPGHGGYGFSDGVDEDSNTRVAVNNQVGTGLSSVKLVFSNWLAGVSEESGQNSITVTASVEYPEGTLTQVTFDGGSVSKVIPIDGNVASDEVALGADIPNGEKFWVRTYVSVAPGEKWPLQYNIRAAGWTQRQEAADFDTGVDRTMSGVITNMSPSSTRRGFGPIAILGCSFTGTPVARSFASFGDSLMMYAGDGLVDSIGSEGWNGRALSGRFPHVNFAISGTKAQDNLSANFTRRRAALALCGVTDVLTDWANNDLAGGRSLAEIQGDLGDIWGMFTADGYVIHHTTTTPRVTGDMKTAAGQAVSTQGGAFEGGTASVRHAYNQWIRGLPSPISGYVEIADAVDVDASNNLTSGGGFWISGNAGVGASSTYLTTTGATTDEATSDGTHPNVKGDSPEFGGHFLMRDAFATYLASL